MGRYLVVRDRKRGAARVPAHPDDRAGRAARGAQLRLGIGRIVASAIEVPIVLANMV